MAFNVLIVDDSSTMRTVIHKTIKLSGFNVGQYLEACDGSEALKILESEWVDLVLTDINMPNMNGLELIAAMRRDQLMESIPVVMVTTEGSEEVVQQSLAMGAKGYIKKPFLPEEIKRTLNLIMGETEDGSKCNDEGDEGFDF